MTDPYTNKDGVLINKLGVVDYDELNKVERSICSIKLRSLDNIKVKYFNEELIQEIHSYIFKDIFDWAGDYRITPLYKEELILPRYSVPYSEPHMISHDLNAKLGDINSTRWNSLDDKELLDVFSRKMALVWKVHPFRDGNTRTIISFSYLFAKEYGFPMDINTLLNNLSRVYKDDRIIRCSLRDRFVLASLDNKDNPEIDGLVKVYKKAINNYRQE